MSPLDDSALGHLREVLRGLPGDTAGDPMPAAPRGAPYALLEEIGRGGMGVVYRAHDRDLDRDVAIKVIAPGAASESRDQMTKRLAREARILARLEHPGIVPVHDVGTLDDGRAFAAMKLVRGQPLSSQLIASAVTDPGTSSRGSHVAQEVAPRLRLFLKILEAVGFAHARGVVHCDLKPSNVMVGAFGEVLVMDWGLARLLGGSEQPKAPDDGTDPLAAPDANAAPAAVGSTAAGAVLGTPGYMAPEQERGERAAIDGRTDVFALGAILLDLVGGADGGIGGPPALISIARRAQSAAPSERYPDVAAMAADVERFLAREPVGAHRERFGEVLRRWYARYEAAVLLVVAYLLLRVVFAIWPR